MTVINRTLILGNIFIVTVLSVTFFFLEFTYASKEEEIRTQLSRKLLSLTSSTDKNYSKENLEEIIILSEKLSKESSDANTNLIGRATLPYHTTDNYQYLDFNKIEEIRQNLRRDSVQLGRIYEYLKNHNISGQKNYSFYKIDKDKENSEQLSHLDSAQESIELVREKLEFAYLANNNLNNMQSTFNYLDAYWRIHSLKKNYSYELFNGIHYTNRQLNVFRQIRYPPDDWEQYFDNDKDIIKQPLELNIFRHFYSDKFPGYYGRISYLKPTLIDQFLGDFVSQKYLRFLHINTFNIETNAYQNEEFKDILTSDICDLPRSALEAYLAHPNFWTDQFSLSNSNIIEEIYENYISMINLELTKKVLDIKAQIRDLRQMPTISKDMEVSEICANIKWQYTLSRSGYLTIELIEGPIWLNSYLEENGFIARRYSNNGWQQEFDRSIFYEIHLNWVLSER